MQGTGRPVASPSSAAVVPPPQPSGAAVTSVPKPAVPAALTFTAPTLAGGRLDGASLFGKAAVLWFWAPWCPTCRSEAPDVAAAAARYAGRVQFVGVPGFAEASAMRQFAADTGLGSMVQAVDDGSLRTRFAIPAQPAFVFIHPDGRLDTVPGWLSPADLETRLAGLAR